MLSRQVMIVEDDECILESLKDLLEGEGFDVCCATNGREALDTLQTKAELPSLIVLDLMMPVMDGFQFRKIQMNDPRFAKIPVVIMSAGSLSDDKSGVQGIKAFLKKPLDIDNFLGVISLARRANVEVH